MCIRDSFSYDEGLCVQCMHIGSYDDEPATVDEMHRFMEEQGYALDITDQRDVYKRQGHGMMKIIYPKMRLWII